VRGINERFVFFREGKETDGEDGEDLGTTVRVMMNFK
jgi:predicted Zn-dependent protease